MLTTRCQRNLVGAPFNPVEEISTKELRTFSFLSLENNFYFSYNFVPRHVVIYIHEIKNDGIYSQSTSRSRSTLELVSPLRSQLLFYSRSLNKRISYKLILIIIINNYYNSIIFIFLLLLFIYFIIIWKLSYYLLALVVSNQALFF